MPSTMVHVCCQAEVRLVRALAGPLEQLQNTALHIGQLQAEAKLPVDPEAFQESFKPYLMDVVYNWSKVGCWFCPLEGRPC